jgi:hypothetical protein
LRPFIFILVTIQCLGQSPKEQLKIANSAHINMKDFYQEIPFVDKAGYFIIPVKIGSDTYEYFFETGGYNTVTTEIMIKNRLPELMQVTTGSSNQIKSKVKLSKVPKLYIGDIEFDSVGVFNFDFDQSPVIKCYANGGLLGKGVIKECVWQIDYRNKIIRVSDKIEKMPNLKNSIKIKVELDHVFNPFIKAEVAGRTEKFMVDFGYGGFISLTEKTAKKCSFANTKEINGEGTIGANGVSSARVFVSNLESLKIGNQVFKNQVAFYSKPNNFNLIGTELSKYFIVTLNFKNSELLLTPVEQITDEAFRTFGFDLNAKDGKIYVSSLYKNQSADKSGLRLNDEVIKINGQSPDTSNYCDFYFLVRELTRSDKEIKIEVKRNKEVAEITIYKTVLGE